jgi:DNA invertase Pin-like site-specific DNA recombinase
MVSNAAIYARISKDSTGKSLGVERQEALCRDLAESKGWEVAQVYVDNDLSAYRGASRPAYEAMLTDLRAGIVDAVLCVDQDRLTRHPMELESFIILADELGVPIANVSGEIDLSTSDGRFRARIMGAVARQESEKKSERVRRQKDQAAGNGWYQGGRRPYGYEQTKTGDGFPTLTIIEEEAEIVREMARRVIDDGESLRSIASDLVARGVPTAAGREWRVTTIRALLTGATIAGLRVHRGEIVGPGNWESILDRATWETVKAILNSRRNTKAGRPATHLLTGLLECSKCGGTLYYRRRGYVCQPNPERANCGGTSISGQVEDLIAAAVLNVLDSPAMAEAITDAKTPDPTGITRQIEQAEASLEQLSIDHYSDARISRREYLAARDALEARLGELRAQLVPEAPTVPRASKSNLRQLWDDADVDTRRQIIGEVIERVVVGPGQRGRHTIDPDRLAITWRA